MTYPSYGSAPEPNPSVPAQPPYQTATPPYQPAPAQPYQVQPHPQQPYPPAQYPAMPAAPLAYKDSTAAWLLWVFLGFFGAHHFYLGRTQRGVAYAVTWGVSLVLSFVVIGFVGYVVLFVLWIIDATQLNQQLTDYNARAYATNRSLGFA